MKLAKVFAARNGQEDVRRLPPGEHLSTAPIYARACQYSGRLFTPASPAAGGSDFRNRENRSASTELRSAIRFAKLPVEPYQVAALAYLAAAVTGLVAAAVGIVLALAVPGVAADPLVLLTGIVLPIALAPLVVLSYLAAYPRRLSARIRARALGRMPEVVQYLAIALRLAPSLTRAISFTANHVDEPLSTALRRILWRVNIRAATSHEEAFLDFAYEWGALNEDFKRALYTVRASLLERTPEATQLALDKAVDGILAATKERMESYSAKLGGPTFILFALGVILPLMMGSMLPLAGMGGIDLGPGAMAVLLLVVFPGAAALYAETILAGRPGTLQAPELPMAARRRMFLVGGVLIGVAVGALALPPAQAIFINANAGSLRLLPVLWGIAAGLSVILLGQAAAAERVRRDVLALERELPDALFQLGSRVADGLALELALERTAETMRGTRIAKLFKRADRRLQLTRDSLDEVLFGARGILAKHPSVTVRAVLRAVVAATEKDPVTAGRTITSIAQYLRDLLRMEADIRNKLGHVVDTMRSTALFFAPIVLGVTTALFAILAGVMAGLQGTPGPLVFAAPSQTAPEIFTLLLGGYLLLSSSIILRFVAGMREGPSNQVAAYEVGRGLPVAIAVFSIATYLGAGLGS